MANVPRFWSVRLAFRCLRTGNAAFRAHPTHTSLIKRLFLSFVAFVPFVAVVPLVPLFHPFSLVLSFVVTTFPLPSTERLASHKKHNAAEDGRRRREETTLSLRKKKQDERLAKRRNLVSAVNSTDAPTAAEVAPATNGPVGTTETPKVASISELPSIVEKLQNYDLGKKSVTDAVRAIRRMVSVEPNSPVDEVIASGALPHLVKLLQCDVPVIIFESAWALTNVASTTRTRSVVDCGAVPHLVNLLRSNVPPLREQAAWCLGNIAGDGPDFRDAVLQAPDCIDAFHANLSAPANPTLLWNTVWAVTNLCGGKPQPPLEIVGPLIPVLCSIVMESDTQEIVTDETLAASLWALSFISDGTDNHIDAVLQTGVTNKLVDITKKENPKHVTPAFHVLGRFATGSEPQTQAVIDAGALPVAHKLMTTGSVSLDTLCAVLCCVVFCCVVLCCVVLCCVAWNDRLGAYKEWNAAARSVFLQGVVSMLC